VRQSASSFAKRLCVASALVGLVLHSAPEPSFTNALAVEPQVNLRLFFETPGFQPMLEFSGKLSRKLDGLAPSAVPGTRLGVDPTLVPGPWHFKLGTYARLFPHIYGGVFYTLAGGLVHDSDWTNFGSDLAPSWGWNTTTARLEHLVTLGLTWRASLDRESRWTLELRAESIWNLSAATNDLKLRPGISVQLGDLRNPVATLFAQYELWLRPYRSWSEPVTTLLPWENWVYAGALFHLGDGLSLGASLAWRHRTWRESTQWRARGWAPYEAGYEALVPSITLVKRISL
jgi:hypothetical protein